MSAGRNARSARPASRAAVASATLAVALALAGCGVKSAPAHPEGSTYPRDYPASGDAKAADKDKEKAKQNGAPALGPQYDYPNRPPPR